MLMIMIIYEFTLALAKFSYVQCLQLQLIIFQTGFDKRHKATDTVAEIANEPKTFKDRLRILKTTRSSF